MNPQRYSSGGLSSASAGSSSHYAEIERGSEFNLIRRKSSSATISRAKSNSSCVRVLAVVSLVLSCLCLACVGLCCWFVFFSDGELPFHSSRLAQKKSEVCLPCLQVSPNPLENSPSDLWGELDVRHDAENDTDICCATNTAQYAALFKLIIQRQEEVKKLADGLDNGGNKSDVLEDVPQDHVIKADQPVSAHLVYKPFTQKSEARSEDASYQRWKSPGESPKSHVKNGLKFHRNRIYVQSPGLYFVYCQVLYSPSYSDSDDKTVVSTYVKRHSILRQSMSGILLKSRHTQYDASMDRHSSYVGGVYELYQGDTLFVQLSRPDLVSHDDTGSFFGLFKIGG